MQQNALQLAARFAGRISLQDTKHVSLQLVFFLLQRLHDRNIPRFKSPS